MMPGDTETIILAGSVMLITLAVLFILVGAGLNKATKAIKKKMRGRTKAK